jgi:hypothetical protein
MLLWLVYGLWGTTAALWRPAGSTVLLWLILLLLGWHVFGAPIHG